MKKMTESSLTKCGFIAVLGEPNAGKSTLINQIVGGKVSIVSHKVQTTRQRILGLTIHDQTQIILVDTPGIFDAKKRLDRAMVNAAWSAGHDADLIILLTDVSQKSQKATKEILNQLDNRRILLVMNKIDQVKRETLLALTAQYADYKNIDRIFMISALNNDGVEDLVAHIVDHLPQGPWLYPEDHMTDLPQRLWAAEITREQLFLQLHHELPYDTMVETEAWEEFNNGSVKISQVIYVARESQKSIVLGKRGHQIKAISEAARGQLSQLLDRTVHLFLHVKHLDDWQNRPAAYRLMGLDYQS